MSYQSTSVNACFYFGTTTAAAAAAAAAVVLVDSVTTSTVEVVYGSSIANLARNNNQ